MREKPLVNVNSSRSSNSCLRTHSKYRKRPFSAACVLCQTILPRIRDSGLFLREVLELVWTLYLPIGCEISWYTEIEYGIVLLKPYSYTASYCTRSMFLFVDDFPCMSPPLRIV